MTSLTAQDKRQMIEHLEHEVAQFRSALVEFTELDQPDVLQLDRDDPVRIRRTAFFEVVLLHARLLDEFLGTEPTHPDDFWAGSFTTNWTKASPLDTVAPVSPGGPSVRESINKQLAHMTTARLSQEEFPIRSIANAVIGGLHHFVGHPDLIGDRGLDQLRMWATWSTRQPPIQAGS